MPQVAHPPFDPAHRDPPSDPDLPGLGPPDPALLQRLRSAVRQQGPSYRPRTHHAAPNATPEYVNRLILATSPYLLQHAHNPVSWYEWGPEPFERARREGKPVFLSVGYSTCHWCHVMERESFEDVEIAQTLNRHYVAVKVDREERPDVDDIYMKAVQLLAGHGGWPMTIVMTPDQEPFFAGTYFPARDGDRGAHVGLLTILHELRRRYASSRTGVRATAELLSHHVRAASAPSPPGAMPSWQTIEQTARGAIDVFDSTWGGFGQAPKFPRPVLLALLLRYHRRRGDGEALAAVTTTLDRMASGGIYDHVGGGFHRYSIDARWLVPHFEKMLYDNAQLVPLYLDAFQVTGRRHYEQVARETLDYVAREMTADGGGFFSATDADSPTTSGEQEEGYFFTWTRSEFEEVLGVDQAQLVANYFAVTEGGNFEGRNVLSTPRPIPVLAAELSLSPADLEQTVAAARAELLAARRCRPPPQRDDKILTAWNGLMISAFSRAALVLGDEQYARRALQATRFVLKHLRRSDGRLLRSFKDGRATHDGFLEDYACLVQALLDLFEVASEPSWLEAAVELQAVLDRHFWDAGGGGYFRTSDTHEALIARDKPAYDGAEPSGNSVAALCLLRLATLTDNGEYRRRAERLFAAFSRDLARSPDLSPNLLCALDYALDRPLEIFIVSPEGGSDPEALLSVLRRTYLPNRAFVRVTEGPDFDRLAALVPALAARGAPDGRVTAFVCEQGRCELPTSDADAFARQIARQTGPQPIG